MAAKSTIVEVENRIQVKPSRRDGILNCDIDNAYYQRMRRAVSLSGRASTCLDVRARFTNGDGLNDKELYALVVNSEGLTMDKLHRKLTRDYALFNGFCIHFNFNGLGKIVSMSHLPFEECRLWIDDDTKKVIGVAHHPDWDEELGKFDASLIRRYHFFNPDPDKIADEAAAAGGMISYTGQVYWYSAAGKNRYPLSTFDPVIEDVYSDTEAKLHRHSNITNNFMPSQIVVMDKFKDPESRKAFLQGAKKHQGGKNTSKVMLVEKDHKDQTFELKVPEVADLDKLFTVTTSETKENIRAIHMIPAVLLSDREPGKLAPAQQDVQDAYGFYNTITAYDRLIFEETYARILPLWHDTKFSSRKDFSILPTSYKSADDSPVKRFGIDGTRAVMDLLSSSLTPQSKINTLVRWYKMPLKDAQEMVLGTEITEEDAA